MVFPEVMTGGVLLFLCVSLNIDCDPPQFGEQEAACFPAASDSRNEQQLGCYVKKCDGVASVSSCHQSKYAESVRQVDCPKQVQT